MSYALVITPAAASQLNALPEELAVFTRGQLARLSDNPTPHASSSPSTPSFSNKPTDTPAPTA